jgi:hypothetical protein
MYLNITLSLVNALLKVELFIQFFPKQSGKQIRNIQEMLELKKVKMR